MKNRPRAALFVAATVALATLTACGSSTGEPSADPTQSPELFYTVIEGNREALHAVFRKDLPTSLPNRVLLTTTSAGEPSRSPGSDAVIAGRVVKVEPLGALHWTNAEEEQYEVADFDDPEASGREVAVTVKVTDAIGVTADDGEFTFTLGVIGGGGGDPHAYMASLRGLGDVVVILDRLTQGMSKGEYRPAMAAGLLGQVRTDGSLSFPGLGEREKEIVAGIDTLDELFTEARKPTIYLNNEEAYG